MTIERIRSFCQNANQLTKKWESYLSLVLPPAVVDYDRREAPGTILIDTDARYLYYVLPEHKAIRYGVTVGEEALAWSGVVKIGRMTEWPSWTPTPELKKRIAVPNYVSPVAENPMGARAMYLYEGNKDTLYRIHGTNQPNISARRSPLAASA